MNNRHFLGPFSVVVGVVGAGCAVVGAVEARLLNVTKNRAREPK